MLPNGPEGRRGQSWDPFPWPSAFNFTTDRTSLLAATELIVPLNRSPCSVPSELRSAASDPSPGIDSRAYCAICEVSGLASNRVRTGTSAAVPICRSCSQMYCLAASVVIFGVQEQSQSQSARSRPTCRRCHVHHLAVDHQYRAAISLPYSYFGNAFHASSTWHLRGHRRLDKERRRRSDKGQQSAKDRLFST